MPSSSRQIPQLTQQQLSQFSQQYQSVRSSANASLHNLDEVNLTKSVNSIIARMREPSSTEANKYQLMLLVAEFKRRGSSPPMQALTVISSIWGKSNNPSFVTQILGLDAEQLAGYARKQLEILKNQRQPGSQTNPIEIATPLQSASQLPQYQTPQTQIQPLQTQPPQPQLAQQQPQPQIAQQQPQLHLSQQQAQLHLPQQQSQQLPQQQAQPQVPQLPQPQPALPPPQPPSTPDQRQVAPPKQKPWDGMDFSMEVFPLGKPQFWEYLTGIASKRGETFVPPMVENRNIDLYKLFSLVLKNGGFSKIFNDLATWSLLAGMIELAPTPPPGQPPRSSPQVAYAIRSAYMHHLHPIEELFYKKLYETRVRSGTVGQPPQPQLPPQPPQLQQASQTLPQPFQPQPQISQPSAQGMSAQFLNAVAIAPAGQLNEQQKRVLEEARRQSQSVSTNAQTANNMQTMQLKANPSSIIPWIRNKEEHMKSRLPVQNKDLSEEQKERFILELKATIPIAKDAQEKSGRFVAMILDKAPADLVQVMQLISVYMFVFNLARHAESRQFISTPNEFAKLRDTLVTHLTKLDAQYEQFISQPGGVAHMQKLMSLIEQPPKPMGPPEDLTAKIPRGLRVEDLKPPPAKRQKVKTAMAAPSPASNPAATPRSEGQGQTPVADSPATRKNTTKRKREASTSIKTPREVVAELKAYPTPPAPAPEPPGNALGIDLNRTTERIREEGFFAAHRALRGINGVDFNAEGGHTSVWSALTNAMEQFRAAPAPAPAPSDDEMFAQFIDVSQMESEPTPELWRVQSRDSEPSPESIRTVGSTGALGFGAEIVEKDEGLVILGGSPEGGAYNGLIMGDWDSLDFGLTGI